MLTLKKFTKMHDDVMMIRVSVKTTRMYANVFNAPKDNCLNSGIEFFYFDFWEFNLFLKISNIHFLWKKNSGKLPKFLEKNAGLLYKKSEKRKVVQAYFSI